ncbi:LADA_0E03180g1_1 [Lachancea dasiensis]|uniref:LADA_0E03180g1_1 n=1 Tax=Lachancea dasiensis TaxID=1072105 RepID=A0A1G4JB50_9SACH|nr:LADA_0E03180g1_1 [Lachancea dasiensis]
MFNATRITYRSQLQFSTSVPIWSASKSAESKNSNSYVTSSLQTSQRRITTDVTSTENSTDTTTIPVKTSTTAISHSGTLSSSTSSAHITSSTTTTASGTPSPISLSVDSGHTVMSYSRSYVITDSSTTFSTELSRVTVIGTQAASTFSAPTSVVTTDVAFYHRWLGGTLDSGSFTGSVSKHHRNTIIASVVGSVGGFLLAILFIWLFLIRRRRKHQSSLDKSFSHDIGCRLDHPLAPPADESNNYIVRRSSDEDEVFMKNKYRSFGRSFRGKIPQWHRGGDRSDIPAVNNSVAARQASQSDPFQEGPNIQKSLPVPPPILTHDLPLHSTFSYTSADSSSSTSSSSEAISDSTSSIQIPRPAGATRSTQSFLRELL